MNPTHGLDGKTLASIVKVLTRFAEVERAVLFGSRAKGTHRNGSDIDLALVGGELNRRILGQIDDALDDLLLPYRFSLVILSNKTDPEVAAHIDRVGITLFQKEHAGAGR
jgi:predicted nucleotidyltransferase